MHSTFIAVKMSKLPCSYDAENKIWKGIPQNNPFKPETSLGRIIFKNMRNWPKNVCQVSEVESDLL